MPKRLAVTVLCAVSLAVAGADLARAQSCGDRISRLAQQYDLAADGARTGTTGAPAAPAAANESRSLTETQGRAQSSGIVTPPDTGAPVATVPPSGSSLPPEAAPPPAKNGSTLAAGDRARLEALLDAARAADRRGDNGQCLERLREAEALPGVPGARQPR
jgi:hypothetical protein